MERDDVPACGHHQAFTAGGLCAGIGQRGDFAADAVLDEREPVVKFLLNCPMHAATRLTNADVQDMKTTPVWLADVEAPHFPPLAADLRVDVLVIGGGITGVTSAFMLKRAGRTVALIERGEIGGGETGHTTAHITYATDTRLTELVKTFGRGNAQAAWDAGHFALEQIADIVEAEDIDCELQRVPGFLVAAGGGDIEAQAKDLEAEAVLVAGLGFDTAYVESAPLLHRPAIRFANQLKFHPLKYHHALARRIPGDGSHVFEKTEAAEFCEERGYVVANGHRIRFSYVVLATHVPLRGSTSAISAALLQTKLAAYSTYAVGAKLAGRHEPEALFWDTADPYLYLRVDRRAGGDYVILGGADHKTGQEDDTGKPFATLERALHAIWPDAAIDHHWSGQVIESVDGLPFIGETSERQFVATGFGGNGMTYGTLAGIMARDRVLGLQNPWEDLFSVERKEFSSLWNYMKENKDYPYYLAKSEITAIPANSLDAVARGEGKILRIHGQKVAAYRDAQGALTTLCPVCPHLGCTVAWNGAEKTWDCPCHGSRFTATGALMGGPAEKPLGNADVPLSAEDAIDVQADTSNLATAGDR
jgi:glycine/D-amino acid oxidase-like deaminating enzyme/Rieske Fe-S protein